MHLMRSIDRRTGESQDPSLHEGLNHRCGRRDFLRASVGFGSLAAVAAYCPWARAETSIAPLRVCTTLNMPPLRREPPVRPVQPPRRGRKRRGDEIDTQSQGLTAETAKLWDPGMTLRVRFLGGDPVVHKRVADAALEWTQHANLAFQFGDFADAHIRIAFNRDQGSYSRSYSLIGRDAQDEQKAPPHLPTMNFGWFDRETPDYEIRRTTLHEFGHAIGFVHEHNNPTVSGKIPWDRAKVYDYYKRPENGGWNQHEVDVNIFQIYDRASTNFTEFDPHSIMLYPIPEELTVGDYSVGWNTKLSEKDKQHAAILYPRPPAPPPAAEEIRCRYCLKPQHRYLCPENPEFYRNRKIGVREPVSPQVP
jgi:hypothetical protein